MPLALLLGFGFLFINLQDQAEDEARKAIRARNISSHITILQGDIMKLVQLANNTQGGEFKTKGYKGSLTRPFKQILNHMKGEYTKLDELTRDNPELNAAVNRSAKTIDEVNDAIKAVTAALIAGNSISFMDAVKQSERMSALEMNWYSQELALIGKTEDDYAEQSLEKQAALRRQLIKYVILLIAANSALSILMALFLVRNITSRLELMKGNAVKLAHNEPLSPALKGSDEIATLDAVFHEMANSIDEAAQAKQNLFNMVTHDIRTPLSSIQGCLELLERADRENSLDERSQKLVKVAVRNSNRTMGLINDLLNSQKIQSGMMTLHTEELQLADSFEEVQMSMADLVSEYGIHLQIKAVDIQS